MTRPSSKRMPIPDTPLHYENIFWIGLLHLVALYAVVFWFSWANLAVAVLLLFTLSPIGINMTFHRLLTHKSFKTPQWFEYVLTTIGGLCGQGPVLMWVAEHRLHHRFSDTPEDPHTPERGFWYAHIGHLFRHKVFEDEPDRWQKYVPDMIDKPYYRFISKYHFLLVALPVPFLYWWGGVAFVLWGVFVRIVLMWHVTWFVNSASHTFGYRNYETNDTSTNCWWVALLGAGEGWHNNHHRFPNSAAHGLRKFEFDVTYYLIRFLEALGLVSDVRCAQYNEDSRIPLNSQTNALESQF